MIASGSWEFKECNLDGLLPLLMMLVFDCGLLLHSRTCHLAVSFAVGMTYEFNVKFYDALTLR